MIQNILATNPGDGSSWAGQVQSSSNYYFDNFGEPLIYALIGFLVVFVGIVIIIGVIWLVGLLMRKTDNLAFLTKKKQKNVAVSPKEQEKTTDSVSDEIPDEVKAAIIAAIMAYYQEKEEKCQFTVKRIKRI